MRFKQGMAVLTATAAALAAVPAAASAGSLWVAHAPTVKGSGKSCTSPGYSTIQSAVNEDSSGAKIEVCTGTYVEQLQITRGLSIVAAGSVTVQLPENPANSTTECDKASLRGLEEHEYGNQPDQDAI